MTSWWTLALLQSGLTRSRVNASPFLPASLMSFHLSVAGSPDLGGYLASLLKEQLFLQQRFRAPLGTTRPVATGISL